MRRKCQVNSYNGKLEMRVILDQYSVEVFVNHGEQVLSATLYTDPAAEGHYLFNRRQGKNECYKIRFAGIMRMKKYDVTAMGELLIDFTENGFSKQGNPLFEANPGGAPCNVLAMLSKLGYKTAFVGKVGNDIFGRQLKVAIEEVGIENGFLLVDEKIHTTLAIVHTLEDGKEIFLYRNPGADMMLTEDEVPENLIANSRMFHFGTLSMTHEGVRAATKKAVQIARKSDCIISFIDPNLRPPLWKNMDEAREQVLWGLKNCDILKISDNEIIWLTGKKNYTEGVRWICERYQIPLIFVFYGGKMEAELTIKDI